MEQYIKKSALVAEIERLVNNQDSALDYEAALEDVRNFLDTLEVKYLQEEPTFKVDDRIRIKGTTVKGDVIKNIYQAEGGNTYFEFENSDDALANEMWELVEDHKEFKPIRKKQPEGVLKELLDNMDEKELEDTRKEMMDESIYTNENLPEIIYCEDDGLGNIVKAHNIRWSNDEAKNIEYIRKYAFIRKAILYLSKHDNYIAFNDIFINDFEEYMKGE